MFLVNKIKFPSSDLSSPQWYSTNLTIENLYQQDYTCRIYFDPLSYIELTQKAVVGKIVETY